MGFILEISNIFKNFGYVVVIVFNVFKIGIVFILDAILIWERMMQRVDIYRYRDIEKIN